MNRILIAFLSGADVWTQATPLIAFLNWDGSWGHTQPTENTLCKIGSVMLRCSAIIFVVGIWDNWCNCWHGCGHLIGQCVQYLLNCSTARPLVYSKYVCMCNKTIYHMSNSHEYMGVNGKLRSCTQFIESHSHARILISINQSHENPYQVLQVTCAVKSKFYMIKSLSP